MASVDPTVRTKRREPIDLSGAHIPGTSLSNADLAGSNFSHANLSKVNFEESNLRGSDLREANLSETNFTGADLSNADLSSANLESATLTRSTLDHADLSHANLSGAVIEGLDLSHTKGLQWRQFLDSCFDDATSLPDNLVEDELFVILEDVYRRRPWRAEFSGRLKDLLMELAGFERLANGSILMSLRMIHAQLDMEEKDAGHEDE
jgi:hypothetical protein